MKTQGYELKLFYDGACHLCSREVDGYLKIDSELKLMPIDISAPDFNAEAEGLDEREVNKHFHVKTKSGQVFSGVEAFATIWDTLGILRPLSWISKTYIGGCAMKAGYAVFAEVRPFLPKRKGCETCKI